MRSVFIALALVSLLVGCADRISREVVCDDGIDDDGNGITDCLDPACSGHPSCGSSPNACSERVAHDVSCGQLLLSSTRGAMAGLPAYGCAEERLLEGPELVYRFVTPVIGQYRASVTAGELAVLTDGPTGCDPAECLSQGAEVVFPSAPGNVIFLVVDGTEAVDFQLAITCPDAISGETLCADGLDNDVDGANDCEDPDCVRAPECSGPTECSAAEQLTCGVPVSGVGHTQSSLAFYQCDADAEPMPYPETVVAFEAPSAGTYRFRLAGDGSAIHELVLMPSTCRNTSCDSVGPESQWTMNAGETVFLAIEGPSDVGWTLIADCPIAQEPGACEATAELSCGETIQVMASGSGPISYSCDGAEEQLGPEAIAVFRAVEAVSVGFSASVVEGPPASQSLHAAWPLLVLGGAGDACMPTQCLDFDEAARVDLAAGEAVWLVADGDIGEEVVSATMHADCSDGGPGQCPALEPASCGATVSLSLDASTANQWTCDGDVVGLFGGPDAGIQFDALESGWVTFSADQGDVFVGPIIADAGCDPGACADSGPAVTRWVEAGSALSAVIEGSAGPASLQVDCHDPSNLGSCTSTATLSCGRPTTVARQTVSALDAYLCDGDIVGGLHGKEAVASFTATEAQTVTFAVPEGVEGFVLVGDGCDPSSCAEAGSLLPVSLQAGETAYVVVDTPLAEDTDEPVVITTDCASPFGVCQPQVTLECGQTYALPLPPTSTLSAYSCGDPSQPDVIAGQTGRDVAMTFSATISGAVEISVDQGKLFLLNPECDSAVCATAKSSHSLFVFADNTVTLVADSDDPEADGVLVTVTCP